MKDKYGEIIDDWTNNTGRANVSTFINNIQYLHNNETTRNLITSANYSWKARKADMILFWKDSWTGDEALKETFPRLYRLSKFKHVYIKDLVDIWRTLQVPKCEIWHRNLRHQELQYAEIVHNLISTFDNSTQEDTLVWKPTEGQYRTTKLYKLLHNTSNNFVESRWFFIWKLTVPPKIKSFLWQVVNSFLLTKDFLAKCHLQQSWGNNKAYFCRV